MASITQISIFLLYAFTVQNLHSQNLNCEWLHSFGGVQSDDGEDAATDSQGNFIIAGEFSGEVDIDPSNNEFILSSFESTDAYIAKYSPNQELLWAFSFDDNNYKSIKSISVISDDRILICGDYYGTCDFDPSDGEFLLESTGWGDAFLAVYSSNGELILAISVGGSQGGDFACSAAVDVVGNYYFGGYFYSLADLDPSDNEFMVNGYSSAMIDMYVVKLSPLGDFIWGGTVSGPGIEIPSKLTIDNAGNLVITGLIEGYADFDLSVGEQIFLNEIDSLNYNCFIAKYTSDGELLDARVFGGTGEDYVKTMLQTTVGYLIGGYYSGGGDFDPGLGSLNFESFGDRDAFLIQLDFDFNVIWSYNFGNEGQDSVNDLALDDFGNIVACGSFEVAIDFDPTSGEYILTVPETFEGVYKDAFALILNPSGEFKEAQNFGGWKDDSGNGIAVSGSKILLLGNFEYEATIGGCSAAVNNEGEPYSDDVFALCFASTYLSVDETNSKPSLVGVYPNPASGEFYITYELPNERQSAFIHIWDLQGKLIQRENISSGFGNLSLSAKNFASGTYVFELELNGQKVATEKFQIVE